MESDERLVAISVSDTTKAGVSQAAAAIGHAVELLDEHRVSGPLRDDTARLSERYAEVLHAIDTAPTKPACTDAG